MTTLEELKARMDEIKNELKKLQESRPDEMEDSERLERAGKLQAEGKILGDRFRAIKLEQQAGIAPVHVETLLSQIKWYRMRQGTYGGNDPILVTQERLREIRAGKGSVEALTRQDVQLLIEATNGSIQHLNQYNYVGLSPESAASFRQQALTPLMEVMPILRGLIKE